MSLFKVNFKNNSAVSVMKMHAGLHKKMKKIVTKGTRQFIRWYLVDAETEERAIEIANKVVRNIWGELLGLR